MRQEKREIKDPAVIEAIIQKAEVCRLAMNDGDVPYIVPMNFGYQNQTLYFHCAQTGKKIDLLRKNNQVAFELESIAEIVRDPALACQWNTRFQSIVGHGRVTFLESASEKLNGLNMIMQHYAEQSEPWVFAEKALDLVCVFKIEIIHMRGKQSKHFLAKEGFDI